MPLPSFIEYEQCNQAPSTIALPSTLTVTETDLYKITDQASLQKSQLTVMASVTLGAVASASFYYYASSDAGTTWFPVSLYNTSTGEITRRTVLVDSGTYSSSSVSYFADSIPMPACNAFKVTAKSASGTPAYSVVVFTRNN